MLILLNVLISILKDIIKKDQINIDAHNNTIPVVKKSAFVIIPPFIVVSNIRGIYNKHIDKDKAATSEAKINSIAET